MGEIVFALLVLSVVFAEMAVWLGGTMTVVLAIFRPKKVAEDRKAKRLLVVYFINAGLCGLWNAYPQTADAVSRSLISWSNLSLRYSRAMR
jgi:hypothetical protein